MARTKQTARKVPIVDVPPYKEEVQEAHEEQVQPEPPVQIRGKTDRVKPLRKRLNYQIKSLKEIRKAQKCTDLLIPKLSFMRVVREISDRLCRMMNTTQFESVRWQSQAILCLQEAAEDFLVEFMNDGYIASAFAHRVTLMSKDFVLVSRLRYTFDKLLKPIPSQDMKAFHILNVPPARKPKDKSTVVIEDITHMYGTRTKVEAQEERDRQKEMEVKQDILSEEKYLKGRISALKASNLVGIKKVSGQMIVQVSYPFEEESLINIFPEDTNILKDFTLEVTDTVLFAALR